MSKRVYKHPPAPPGYSFWQLFSLYKQCPYSYKLAFKDQVKPNFAARPRLCHLTFRGAVFHDVMERKVDDHWSWEESKQQLFNRAKEVLQSKAGIGVDRSTFRNVINELRQCLDFIETGPENIRKLIESIKETELPIHSEIEKGCIIKGRVDGKGVIEEVPDSSFYIDWKAMDTISGSASRQLAFYCVVKPVTHAYVYYPMLGELKPVRLSEKRLIILKEEIMRLIKGIEEGRFSKNYSRCSYCFYFEVCRPRRRRKY